MDPISSAPGRVATWARPSGGAPDLASVLRAGRLLAGEVLQTLSGGTILIGVGRHRIAATADGRLEPGARYLFEVVSDGETPELRVVSGARSDADDGLAQVLRDALSNEQPLGSVLESLAGLLERELAADPARRGPLQRLLDALRAHVLRPGAGGAEFSSLLNTGGLAYEARWAALAQKSAPGGREGFASLVRSLVAAELGGEASFDALAAAFQRAHPSRAAAPELVRALAVLLERAAKDSSLPEAALARLRELDVGAWPAGMRRALLRALLAIESDREESAGEVARQAGELARDLKSELLRARSELEPGSAKRAVERALATLEAEQALNVARGTAHEPLQWSFPLLDGERWTTAHLYLHRDAAEARGSTGRAASRLALSVELSGAGPVHADVLLADGGLAVRILVAREDVARALAARLPELEQHLAFGGRPVRTAVSVEPEERLRAEDGVRDLGLLHERSVMDVLG